MHIVVAILIKRILAMQPLHVWTPQIRNTVKLLQDFSVVAAIMQVILMAIHTVQQVIWVADVPVVMYVKVLYAQIVAVNVWAAI